MLHLEIKKKRIFFLELNNSYNSYLPRYSDHVGQFNKTKVDEYRVSRDKKTGGCFREIKKKNS